MMNTDKKLLKEAGAQDRLHRELANPTFKKRDAVQFIGDGERGTVMEGPYTFNHGGDDNQGPSYTVNFSKMGVKVVRKSDIRMATYEPTLLEAVKNLLAHHRVHDLEMTNTSDTLQPRFEELRVAIIRAEAKKS